MEMVKKEIGEMKKSLKAMEQACIKKRAYLKARLEEAELRILETEEIKKEFQEKIVESRLTGKIPAEKFIRWIILSCYYYYYYYIQLTLLQLLFK